MAPGWVLAQELQLSAQALQQIQALLEEKEARTPAQQRIDSQLLAKARMARGEPIALGISTLRTGITVEEDGRVLVDIKAREDQDMKAEVEALGGTVLNHTTKEPYHYIRFCRK